jgi:hypothetical protein
MNCQEVIILKLPVSGPQGVTTECLAIRTSNRAMVEDPDFLSDASFIRVPFAKFVDSPYYSESELCGGAVTVSFSKYLPWQAMHFLQRSTHAADR